ncbi:hypothetical protein HGRIS_001508 [Hohenbuehelia grisea]|uniref:Uncharacterized protein n=1 Tax=Hohenbuehelia grisea TaxID=104357 RepID=A0ABR3JQ40_9AGAR
MAASSALDGYPLSLSYFWDRSHWRHWKQHLRSITNCSTSSIMASWLSFHLALQYDALAHPWIHQLRPHISGNEQKPCLARSVVNNGVYIRRIRADDLGVPSSTLSSLQSGRAFT